MNGEALTKEHGFPVRVVVPGIAGARSVKWLDRITVQTMESSNFYQQHDYKILPPEAVDTESAEKFWDTTPALQTMPVNSAIAVPEPGSRVERSAEGKVRVKGFALPSGDGGAVVKVEVSGDGGKTWTEAEIEHDAYESKWSWRLWRANIEMSTGKGLKILSKATDEAGQVQPERSQWNLRGVAYNGFGETTDVEVV